MRLNGFALRMVSGLALAGCGGSDNDAPAQPQVIAHRGASGYLPEHTLGGYELAIRMGADFIEPDLQLTKDGALVAIHDDTLTRTTNVAALFAQRNGSYKVSDFTLAEIKTLTVIPTGTGKTSYPGFTPSAANPFTVPTFQEVVDFAKKQSSAVGREVGIYPEAKQADPVMDRALPYLGGQPARELWRTAAARNFASHRRWALRTFVVVNGVFFLRMMVFGYIILAQAPPTDKPPPVGAFQLGSRIQEPEISMDASTDQRETLWHLIKDDDQSDSRLEAGQDGG